jgi:hypothetical protein
LKRSKIVCVLIAPILLMACGGPVREAEPAPSGPTHVAAVAESGPALTAAEAQSVLEASVQVAEITGTASKATVKFDEYGTQYLASDTTGPSDVPEQYRVQGTATFIMTDLGWVLDEVLPDDGQFGLPFSMVDPGLPPEP